MLQGRAVRASVLGVDANPDLATGFHLQWRFRPQLGFPAHGFSVWRRRAVVGKHVSLDLTPAIGLHTDGIELPRIRINGPGALIVVASWLGSATPAILVPVGSTVRIRFRDCVRGARVRIAHLAGTVTLAALDAGTEVVKTRSNAGAGLHELTVAADRIDELAITVPGPAAVMDIATIAQQPVDGDWHLVVRTNLPTSWHEAAARLPHGERARFAPHYEALARIISDRGLGQIMLHGDPEAPSMSVSPTKLLLMAALAPEVAAMLGLMHVDHPGNPGPFDYRFDGHWTSPDQADERWIAWGVTRKPLPAIPMPTGFRALESSSSWRALSGRRPAAISLAWDRPPRAASLAWGGLAGFALRRERRNSTGAYVDSVSLGKLLPAGQGDRIDGPLENGTWRYSLCAVDLFGRKGPAATAEVTTSASLPPPPPDAVAARAITAAGVSVTFRWDSARRTAFAARRFHVHATRASELTGDRRDIGAWPAALATAEVGTATEHAVMLDVATMVSAGQPVLDLLVTVVTEDEAGVRGPPSVAASATLIYRVSPDAPGAPFGTGRATRADGSGMATWTAKIETSAGLDYELSRALDSALGGGVVDDDAALAARAVDRDSAFTVIARMVGTGRQVTHTDTLPGTGANRFVYRVTALDAAGNRSAPSPVCIVSLYPRPPKPPVVLAADPDIGAITLRWTCRAGLEVLVERALAPVDDTSAWQRVARVTATSCIDRDVIGLVDYAYRLVAFAGAGVQSEPSAIVVARAIATPPAPPTWRSATRHGERIELRWSSEDGADAIVERRLASFAGGPWVPATGWLGVGARSCSLESASSETYRVRIRAASGLVATGDETTVEAS